MQIGDYIRFGRVTFRVSEMRKGDKIFDKSTKNVNIYIDDIKTNNF